MMLLRRRLLLLICLHLWTMKILKVWLKWTPRDGCLHPPTLSTTCQVVSARPPTHPHRVMRNPMGKNYVKFGSSKVKLHLCNLCFTRANPRRYFRRIRVVASCSAFVGLASIVTSTHPPTPQHPREIPSTPTHPPAAQLYGTHPVTDSPARITKPRVKAMLGHF